MDIPSLRVRNTLASLFNPQTSQMNQIEQPIQEDPNEVIRQLLNPANTAQSQLNTQLQSMPQRKDFRPSLMTNIMSRLSGLSSSSVQGISGGQPVGYRGMGQAGSEMIDEGLNRGYNQAISDWDAKLKPLSLLASDEQKTNTNNRLTGSTILRDQKADEDRLLKEKQGNDKIALEQAKLDQKKSYAALIKAKNEQPNAAMAIDKNGKVYTWDKKSGEFLGYVTDEDDNILESDKLPDEERLRITNNNRLQQIAAQGSQTRSTEGVRQDNREELEDIKDKNRTTLEGVKQSNRITTKTTSSGNTETPSPIKNKIGDKKVFPNGKVGQWDGQGWKPTGETVK